MFEPEPVRLNLQDRLCRRDPLQITLDAIEVHLELGSRKDALKAYLRLRPEDWRDFRLQEPLHPAVRELDASIIAEFEAFQVGSKSEAEVRTSLGLPQREI